ncbi:L-dopachrome tautomerase yellow-f-like [Vanessa atalanta]|uniref:L-dopachrome tautomerase yellow-f-like n=1 Tax=Vanessa atalanta TaxID=42275 RepID=UPI001FCD5A8A|nr:L-dopachrome tautomerase yellow-f-like [Vanessa atalanta]XP_047542950.1 L-dopachrome tautomerase yellow-f-like [Vanessa atalanta]XP_047542951.1 L-dopachrome tautomerase yellow-f-like [Vanessa atalanta]
MFFRTIHIFVILLLTKSSLQQTRRLGRFREIFAWKQLTYNINGNILLQDRFGDIEDNRKKRETGKIVFQNDKSESGDRDWNEPPQNATNNTSTTDPSSEVGSFFIQYNNVPMGVERVGERLFITVPRRRYGIPSTLNYIDLKDSKSRSPSLRPYPDLWQARSLTSVYRTRADKCGRLWMVDTGLLEIPDNPRQLQTPAIVIFDLKNDKQILRYPFKSSDIPAANTPTGLASLTVDINEDCSDAYAYVVDLTTFGIIVYSLKDNDSWRHTHAYLHFNPTAANLNIAGESFQWSDGVFSITLTEPQADGCRTAYFHPLISTEEFAVSTCVLKNRAIRSDRNYFSLYSYVGKRGDGSQSTMHEYHQKSGTIFFAEIGRDAVSCWNSGKMLNPSNIAMLAQDRQRMSYPSDLHVTDDEVWVMANTLPRFGYSRLDTNEYNFYIYSGNVNELIADTVCSAPRMYLEFKKND